ncbi:MAG: GNAT family N-acetyltransferase [Vicinamibacteria bacterium]
MSLRPAVDADRPGICAVHVAAIRGTCSRAYTAEQISSWAGLLSPDSYTGVLRERVMLVATDGDEVVGFGQLNAETGEVDAVYVLPERQGEGIGRALLSELERQARDRGVARLELSATLNATAFYERAGYARQTAALHRLPTGVDLQCIRMSRRIGLLDRS